MLCPELSQLTMNWFAYGLGFLTIPAAIGVWKFAKWSVVTLYDTIISNLHRGVKRRQQQQQNDRQEQRQPQHQPQQPKGQGGGHGGKHQNSGGQPYQQQQQRHDVHAVQ
jgi:hypothetical protein